MKAVVYKGPGKVRVEEVNDPKIVHPGDAIIRLTSSAICGSDLHMYEGRTAVKPGSILGHEPLGVVEKTGDAVVSVKKGDRVAVTFNIACGYCDNCVRGYTNACLTTTAGSLGFVGPYGGAQAEYLRVPFADFNCIKLPGTPGDKWEDDFVLLADIFPTGFHATELAMVMPGMDVAVYGAGPVGLLAAYSAILKGASQVYVVDYIPERLRKAKKIGAMPIDFTKGDPVDQIRTIKAGNPANTGKDAMMSGVMCGIDAIGYQVRDRKNPREENPTQIIDDLVRLVNPTGHLGIIGVFLPEDPGAPTDDGKQGNFMIPWGKIWINGLTIGTGVTPVKKHALNLRDLIITGKAKPSFIVSHRIPIEDAPEAYQKFDERYDGYTKVVIKFE